MGTAGTEESDSPPGPCDPVLLSTVTAHTSAINHCYDHFHLDRLTSFRGPSVDIQLIGFNETNKSYKALLLGSGFKFKRCYLGNRSWPSK